MSLYNEDRDLTFLNNSLRLLDSSKFRLLLYFAKDIRMLFSSWIQDLP